jgi:hypothetical protein
MRKVARLAGAEPRSKGMGDADRLDLPRCGQKVNPKFLSTQAARNMLA